MYTMALIIKTETEDIFIDAYSGALLLKDRYKTVYGGAMAVPDFVTADTALSMAQNGLQNLGYNTTSSVKTAYLHANVPYYLNEGFYISSHGNSTEVTSRKNGVSDLDRKFHYYEVSSSINYELVFLDACETAAASYWNNAFGITNSSQSKAFLGWNYTVGEYASLYYCNCFWPLIVTTGSVGLAAAQTVSYVSQYYCPISFTGDYNFDGYHY